MSLTKLFNFKFMKQILKKSKGQLIIFLCLVPIFTFLSLLTSFSGEAVGVLDIDNLSIINFLGMYVIPVILSINLFNYIYKRASVDFINSMPISKKTIFLSNTLLGIILIILMQFVNVVGIFIFTLLKPEIIFFSEMIWDIFFVTTVSYIFVFTASNLAMCLSGNVTTQIAVTCLIVFFIPFLVNDFYGNIFDIRTGEYYLKTENYIVDENEMTSLVEVDAFNETMPYRFMKCLFSSNLNFYNSISIVKMIILAIIYSIIGSFMFKKRKFENLGESFRTIKAHEFVKALTMFPMFAVLNKLDVLDLDIEFIFLIYAILIAYFIIYDVITAKKVKFKITLLSIIIIFAILNGITLGIEEIIDEREEKIYTMDDIKSVSVDLSGYREYYSEILNYEITDRNIIDEILNNNYSFVSTTKVKMNDGRELFIDRIYTSVDKMDYSKDNLIELLNQDENYGKTLIDSKLVDGYYTLYNDTKLTGELEKEVREIVDNYQKENLNEDSLVINSVFDIKKYYYENHQINKEIYTFDNMELRDKIAQIHNDDFVEYIKEIKDEDIYIPFNIRDNNIERTAYIDDSDSIIDIILKASNKVDLNKRYVIITSYSSPEKDRYYITNNEDIIRMFDMEVSRMMKEDAYYYKDLEEETIVVESVEEIPINTVTNEIENTVANVVN